ncbi:MAG: hypothetical protein U9Q34_00530 [Elusimicrobiota bacterium]|nr:hypothetical protein [Elusimicrobiota bacterium]
MTNLSTEWHDQAEDCYYCSVLIEDAESRLGKGNWPKKLIMDYFHGKYPFMRGMALYGKWKVAYDELKKGEIKGNT